MTTVPFWDYFVYLAYDRGLVLLWRRCNTLYTSGFADDIIFT